MKILMAADTYRPRVNGVVTSIDTFSNEYRKKGHEVTIVAPEYPEDQKDVKDPSNEKYVVRLPSSYIFFDPEDRWTDVKSKKARAIIDEKILNQKFDLIHTHVSGPLGIEAVKWGRQMNCPVIHTYHTLFEQYVHYIKFIPRFIGVKIARWVSKWYCDKMDLVVAPSTQMKDALHGYKVKKEVPIVVTPTGIKIDKFVNYSGPRFREKHGISKATTLFLFMGRIGHEKNIPFLFDMLKEIRKERPDTKLVVAGKGPAEETVKKAAADKGVTEHVIFIGYLDPQEWVDCYAAADLFTFSSITETQGLVVTEAMAAETPVVAIAEMGVAEVMASQKGGLLVKNDLTEFVAAVKRMLTDKQLYAQKKSEARAAAEDWSAESMAKKMLTNYENVIKKYAAKSGKK